MLGLSRLLEAKAKSEQDKDTAVIFVWLPGGAPHMETYDMKPDAPSTHRGEFRPIKTNVPGMEVCELLHLRQCHASCIKLAPAHRAGTIAADNFDGDRHFKCFVSSGFLY